MVDKLIVTYLTTTVPMYVSKQKKTDG